MFSKTVSFALCKCLSSGHVRTFLQNHRMCLLRNNVVLVKESLNVSRLQDLKWCDLDFISGDTKEFL